MHTNVDILLFVDKISVMKRDLQNCVLNDPDRKDTNIASCFETKTIGKRQLKVIYRASRNTQENNSLQTSLVYLL